MTRPRIDRIDPVRGERLAIARVLCILSMIWVHVPGTAAPAAARTFDVADWPGTLQALLVESVGRSGAALLGVVSGWLCAHLLLGGRAPRALIVARARTLLVPMLTWGLVTVAVYGLVSLVRPTFLSVPGPVDAAAVLRWANGVAFLSAAPSGPTLHLSFLRDLFVCACLAPALLASLARWPRTSLAVLGALYVADLDSVLVLRPLVLFSFALGLWLARARVRLEGADHRLGTWVTLLLACSAAVMLANAGAFAGLDGALHRFGLDVRESVLYPLSRLFGSLAVWALTARLAGRRAGRAVAAQMTWLFTTYCSHFLVLALLWEGLLEPLGAGASTAGFAAWFLCAPLVALVVGRSIVRVTLARCPRAVPLLGLRVPVPPPGRRGAGADAGRGVPQL